MDIRQYFKVLDQQVRKQYDIAGAARAKGFDPSLEVEALPTRNLAERVEGLVGPKYIADEIKKCQEEKLPREKIVERIIDWILKGTYLKDLSKQQRIEQALRTSLAILTEGVVSAPLEGISQVTIEKNPDGSDYLSVYYAGPIRGAGGTAAALSVLLADYIRRKEGIRDYRPTDDEVERYKEELKIYHRRIVRLQYMPTDDEINLIVRNVPICIDGDPTEDQEVDLHKGLARVKTDRVRGGICLVIGEGLAQKYKKVMKFAEAMDLKGWEWLKDMKKGASAGKSVEIRKILPNRKFLEDIVAGRPIFAYPMEKGGFRLRYGRSNMCGVASKAIHPATMEILQEFPVVGTQMRIERPGKGMVVVPCAEMEGPVIKEASGTVRLISTIQEAKAALIDVDEILSLGDILIPFGDFLQSNEVLPPSGYVEEWWAMDYAKAGGACLEELDINGANALEVSTRLKIPLHPKYTAVWHDISVKELQALLSWFEVADFDFAKNKLVLKNDNPIAKRVLEFLLIPHTASEEKVVLEDYAIPIVASLGLLSCKELDFKNAKKVLGEFKDDDNAYDAIQKLSPVTIRRKVGCYIGARMGRPEKAKERMMEPASHVLFPIGEEGGNTRSIIKASKNTFVRAEVARMRCPKCKKLTFMTHCPDCGEHTSVEYKCTCGAMSAESFCKRCKRDMSAYELAELPVKSLFETAESKLKQRPSELKGVKGMSSATKIPEPIDKGVLRAANGVFVFKDGTIRYDATDVPSTHFRPKDIGVSVERVKELGYDKDTYGKPLERDDQVVQLLAQDIIIPVESIGYLTRTCNFVDDLLKGFYGLDEFYKVKTKEDLVGQLVVGLAPHTSAAILGRILGFADVRCILAHPFWHSAKRRNCDGDEDSIMLLMDVLLNFSYSYLPERRGGRMDAPLVINTNLDPKEVDDEAHSMEMGYSYPLEFYEKTLELPLAKELKMIDIVKNHLEDNPFDMGLTKFSTWAGAPKESRYVQLGEMAEKTDVELKLCKKIRAVDVNDAAKRLVDYHLIRDTYGNLRAFARQKFRCVKCNRKYRRVPLVGKCQKCGGKVILTVSKGTIEKYVDLTDDVVKHYIASEYIKQRMDLLKLEISSVFENEKVRQFSLSEFA